MDFGFVLSAKQPHILEVADHFHRVFLFNSSMVGVNCVEAESLLRYSPSKYHPLHIYTLSIVLGNCIKFQAQTNFHPPNPNTSPACLRSGP